MPHVDETGNVQARGLSKEVTTAFYPAESSNLTKVASQGMPQTTGRKPGNHGRSDKQARHTPQQQRCTKHFSCRMPVTHHSINADETDI